MRVSTILAGTMALSGAALLSTADAQQTPTQQQQPAVQQQHMQEPQMQQHMQQGQQIQQQHMQQGQQAMLKLPAGVAANEDVDADGMYETLTEISEAGMTIGGFNDLVERLVDMDRNRIGDYADRDFTDLNDQVTKLQAAFRAKYNQDFDLDEEEVFQPVAKAMSGDIQDPVAVLQSWPLPATPGSGEPIRASVREPALTERVREQGNIEEGRTIGVVALSGMGKLPALQLSMVDEAAEWKVDIPNNMTGQQLHDALLAQLTALNQNVQQWPADALTAKRVISHQIFMSLYGLGPTGQPQQGQQIPGQQMQGQQTLPQ